MRSGLTDEPEAGDLAGLFGAGHLAEITDDPASIQIYLCGPAPLMASVEGHFAELGLAERVHVERFGPLRLDPAIDTGDGVVSFEHSAVTVAASGTLLETAEAAGLAPKFGCRRGICGTCTTTKTAGVVTNVVTGNRSAADAEPVRLCVSVARGDVAVAL